MPVEVSRLDRESEAYTKVSIWRNGNVYQLRASLPPKPGKTGGHKQQWVSIGCKATKPGLRVAKAKAAKLESDLLMERFSWGDWLKGRATPGAVKTTHDWVVAFLEWKREAVKETTIRNDYQPYTQLVDSSQLITSELLTEACRQGTQPNSRARKACVRCLKELGRYAGLEIDWTGLAGNYSPEPFDPKDLPSDEAIEQIWQGIDSRIVQWTYGMMATYGIRPHEIYHLDCSRLGRDNVLVVLRAKTQRRVAYPCLGDWVEKFRLWDIQALQAKEGTPNKRLGERTSKAFKRHAVPHIPYALRHAYAVRLARMGVKAQIAAKWMGHSLAVHEKTYLAALSEREYQEVWDKLLKPKS